MADLGTDSTLDPRLGMVSGRQLLAADLIERLSEEPGGLYYDASYGAGIVLSLNDDVDAESLRNLAARVEEHCRRDERVESARCVATFNYSLESIDLRIQVEDSDGPFEFVYSLSGTTNEASGSALTASLVATPPAIPWGGWNLVWGSVDLGVFDSTFDWTFE